MDDRRRLLAVGDAGALILFAVIGLLSHDKGIGPHGLFRDAVPVVAGWFAAAAVFRTYRRSSWPPFFAAWAVGVTAGVLLRGLVLGRHVFSGKELTFLAVTLVATLVLLLAWRGLFALTGRRARTLVP